MPVKVTGVHGDEWAAIAKSRHEARPATSSTAADHSPQRTSRSTRRLRQRDKTHKAYMAEEPQFDDDDNSEESLLFRPAPAFEKTVVRPRSDATSQLTALLGSAEEKLREQLLIASEKGKKHAVYLLLHQRLVDRDRCRGMRGYTPLHHAATRGHLEVLQLFVEFGWSVDTCNDSFETPLHLASYNGHTAITEFLLDKGANVNALTCDGETPLFHAARKNHYRVIRLLIRRECDLSLKNRFGDVAQDEASGEKALMEFAVGREDLERLYRRSASVLLKTSTTTSRKTLPAAATLFRGEVTLAQKQREGVLAFLDLKSLCRASQVSYRWHRAADTPALWRRFGVSRWELLLQTTVGHGAVSPMAMLSLGGGAGGLQLNNASLMGSKSKTKSHAQSLPPRRPSSCDYQGVGAASSRFATPSKYNSTSIANSGIFLDHRRPQTSRPPGQ